MANIRVDVDYTIMDGSEVVFRSPVDCSQITGLKVYYIGSSGSAASKVFTLADAHGNNVGVIDNLFAEDVVVKVILDVTKGMAFVQNADTNAYLEEQLASKAPAGFGLGGSQSFTNGNIGDICATGWYHAHQTLTIGGLSADYWYLHVKSYSDGLQHCRQELYPVALGNNGCKLVRIKLSGTWQEWVWENPPMLLGVEYRTTERCEGNPVYRKRIAYTHTDNIGTVGTVTGFNVPHGISNLDTVVRIFGKAGTNVLPYYTSTGDWTAVTHTTSSSIAIRTNGTWTGRTWIFDMAYTKS
jgi:hypothetical protein